MTDAADANANGTHADATDATDATDCTESPKSRKRAARDPVERALKALGKSVKIGKSPGFLSLLCLLFIGLKLTGHIDWSWWWVLAPILIKGPLLILLILVVVFAFKLKDRITSGDT